MITCPADDLLNLGIYQGSHTDRVVEFVCGEWTANRGLPTSPRRHLNEVALEPLSI